jgi:hypothetical protein
LPEVLKEFAVRRKNRDKKRMFSGQDHEQIKVDNADQDK